MADVTDGGGCRECGGTGRVMLFVSSAPCTACGGTGRAAGDAGPAAAKVPPAPAAFSVAHARGYALCGGAGQAEPVAETAYDAKGRLLWRRQQLPAALGGGIACFWDEGDAPDQGGGGAP